MIVRNGKPRIVVLGGGFAGLESVFTLRARLGSQADLTLVSDRNSFLFKPNTIYIPFGADPASLLIPLGLPTAKRDIAFLSARVDGVDPDAQIVELDGTTLPYDFLVVATGADMRPEEIPGLAEHAETIWTSAEMAALGRRLEHVVRDAKSGEQQRILFLVPPNNKCAGPLYELVLMTETWLRRRKVRDRVKLVFETYEQSFIQAFGPKLHDVVATEFAQRGISGHTSRRVKSIAADEARFEDGGRVGYDLLVAFPPYVAAVTYDGLVSDDRGFLRTEPASRRVVGQERIYAPGDAGDFPVKQAFLAFLQADAAADDIAAQLLGTVPHTPFEPVSMCVMEEYDKATFAQVPLETTGNPAAPVRVRADANGAYRVGVSPAWRFGKKLLGFYLPLRFRAGLPFHSGLPWKGMELGLKGMSAVLARR